MATGPRAGPHEEVADLGGQLVELGCRQPPQVARGRDLLQAHPATVTIGRAGRAASEEPEQVVLDRGRPRPRRSRRGRRTSASSTAGTAPRSPPSPAASGPTGRQCSTLDVARRRSTSLPSGRELLLRPLVDHHDHPPGPQGRPHRGQRLDRVRQVVQGLEVERDVVRRPRRAGLPASATSKRTRSASAVRLGVGARVHHRRVVAVDPEHLEAGVRRGERDRSTSPTPQPRSSARAPGRDSSVGHAGQGGHPLLGQLAEEAGRG